MIGFIPRANVIGASHVSVLVHKAARRLELGQLSGQERRHPCKFNPSEASSVSNYIPLFGSSLPKMPAIQSLGSIQLPGVYPQG